MISGTNIIEYPRNAYIRGQGIKPNVPEEVIAEAKDYLTRGRQAQIAFLREVYQQIVVSGDGSYAQRFKKREGEIAPVLNYFADKLRSFGQTTAAEKLAAKVREQFPRTKEEENNGKPPKFLENFIK